MSTSMQDRISALSNEFEKKGIKPTGSEEESVQEKLSEEKPLDEEKLEESNDAEDFTAVVMGDSGSRPVPYIKDAEKVDTEADVELDLSGAYTSSNYAEKASETVDMPPRRETVEEPEAVLKDPESTSYIREFPTALLNVAMAMFPGKSQTKALSCYIAYYSGITQGLSDDLIDYVEAKKRKDDKNDPLKVLTSQVGALTAKIKQLELNILAVELGTASLIHDKFGYAQGGYPKNASELDFNKVGVLTVKDRLEHSGKAVKMDAAAKKGREIYHSKYSAK